MHLRVLPSSKTRVFENTSGTSELSLSDLLSFEGAPLARKKRSSHFICFCRLRERGQKRKRERGGRREGVREGGSVRERKGEGEGGR